MRNFILIPFLFAACSSNPYNGDTGAADGSEYIYEYKSWYCPVCDDTLPSWASSCDEWADDEGGWVGRCVDSSVADRCIDWMHSDAASECAIPEECYTTVFVPCPEE